MKRTLYSPQDVRIALHVCCIRAFHLARRVLKNYREDCVLELIVVVIIAPSPTRDRVAGPKPYPTMEDALVKQILNGVCIYNEPTSHRYYQYLAHTGVPHNIEFSFRSLFPTVLRQNRSTCSLEISPRKNLQSNHQVLLYLIQLVPPHHDVSKEGQVQHR